MKSRRPSICCWTSFSSTGRARCRRRWRTGSRRRRRRPRPAAPAGRGRPSRRLEPALSALTGGAGVCGRGAVRGGGARRVRPSARVASVAASARVASSAPPVASARVASVVSPCSPASSALRQLERRGVAGLGLALQAQPDRVVELGRDLGPVVGDRLDRLLLLLERQLGQRAVLVRQPPGEELVGADPERVDVRRRPGLVAARLLGREVGGGAEHRADLGDARLLGRLGDAEVGQLGGARLAARPAGCRASRRGARRRRGGRSRGRGRRRARSAPPPRSSSCLCSRSRSAQEGPSTYSMTM